LKLLFNGRFVSVKSHPSLAEGISMAI
jgi:hypothetical protein